MQLLRDLILALGSIMNYPVQIMTILFYVIYFVKMDFTDENGCELCECIGAVDIKD